MSEKRKITAANSSRGGIVGYGRPPIETRFKPGVSGNAAGRPKRSRNLKTIIRTALTAHVTVREGEKKRSVTKLEGIVLRQLESALKGNDKAALATLKMAAQVGLLEVGETEIDAPQLSAGEQQIVDELLSSQSNRPRRSKRRAKVSKA